jgi:hypothetical protein
VRVQSGRVREWANERARVGIVERVERVVGEKE